MITKKPLEESHCSKDKYWCIQKWIVMIARIMLSLSVSEDTPLQQAVSNTVVLFALTIHKVQGKILENVPTYLGKPIF